MCQIRFLRTLDILFAQIVGLKSPQETLKRLPPPSVERIWHTHDSHGQIWPSLSIESLPFVKLPTRRSEATLGLLFSGSRGKRLRRTLPRSNPLHPTPQAPLNPTRCEPYNVRPPNYTASAPSQPIMQAAIKHACEADVCWIGGACWIGRCVVQSVLAAKGSPQVSHLCDDGSGIIQSNRCTTRVRRCW